MRSWRPRNQGGTEENCGGKNIRNQEEDWITTGTSVEMDADHGGSAVYFRRYRNGKICTHLCTYTQTQTHGYMHHINRIWICERGSHGQ